MNISPSSTPVVSAVIPAYNAERTIETTLNSALSQTVRDIEVIVCNDASTDGTGEILASYHDPRVRVITNSRNSGEGAARDSAIATSQGKWIAVLDADDSWHPGRLEAMVSAAGADANVMVFDDILICHHTKNGLRPWRPMRGPHAFGAHDGHAVNVSPAHWASTRQFLIKPLIPAAALRASSVRHSELRFSADTEFFLRLVAAGMKLRYVPKAYYHYRIMPGSMSATSERAQLMRDMLIHTLTLFENDAAMSLALKRKISYRDLTMAIKSGNALAAFRLAWQSPSLATELITRGFEELPYHFDRIMHRGSGRGKRAE